MYNSIDRSSQTKRENDQSLITRFQEVSQRSGISQCNDPDIRLGLPAWGSIEIIDRADRI